MKYLISSLFLGLVLVSCKNNSHELIQKQNVAIVEDYIKAVEKLDHDAMANFLSDDYMGNGPSHGDTINKVQAVANWKANVETRYESVHYDRSKCAPLIIEDGPEKGDWVINWAELNIKFREDSAHVIIWAITSYKIENGKIKKSITVYNEADALRQMGYIIIPGR
jgi:hypothetical protein